MNLRGLGGASQTLERALQWIQRRGPDGYGVWMDDRCALGHRRLAIIDLSEGGHQPMQRDALVITFNGEIYNHENLRRELEIHGHSFRSRSDTEVILAGWQEWGEALLPKLSGMFAFALWDAKQGEIVLATDRFGKKPLVYAIEGQQLSFASDLRALRDISGLSAEIDQEALRLLFALRHIPAPWTILKAARKLPAASVARFGVSGLTIRRWDAQTSPSRPVFTDRLEATAALKECLDRAVLDRLVADVPVGAFLSGGIDSAIVCASLAVQGRKVRTFTVGFPDAADYYEERPAARLVARHLGIDHTEVEIGAADALAAIDDVFEAADEPFADSSALPVYLLSRETRRHVTVALSGDGADEVFAGYRKYQGELLADNWRCVPTFLRHSVFGKLLDTLPEGKHNSLLEYIRRVRKFAEHADKAPAARYAAWMSQVNESELEELFPGATAAPKVEHLVEQLLAESEGDPINRMLAVEQKLGLTSDMLRKVDLMSMANSLEVRCPFLDRSVTELAAAIPGRWKLELGRGKAILREAFADRLPPEVFRLPKKGFEMPIAEWLRTSLRERLQAASDPRLLRRQGMINPEPVQRWVADLFSGRRDTSWQLWTLLCFQSWMQREKV